MLKRTRMRRELGRHKVCTEQAAGDITRGCVTTCVRVQAVSASTPSLSPIPGISISPGERGIYRREMCSCSSAGALQPPDAKQRAYWYK